MRFLPSTLSWSAVSCLILSAVMLAASPARAESSEEAVCGGESRSAERVQGLYCYESDCIWDSDCWNACPSARSTYCDGNNVCVHELGGGGGGGGGGGPTCEMRDCYDDSQCECNGRPGSCGSDGTCSY
ncbi:hypothetical protein [Myxococcus landrumensis]|uniref:Lipoprotein n=1 Tax=Myxococcus landrumensis TaxID=2813577 RepID=A0ABX7MWN8_9BACT|nr:hypothetical protein [Myxococcus landrumus]QSQ10814.1 hypothetical protein JY572_20500 [Myxococcus landrumus]